MSSVSLVTTPEQQRALERFYFHEARLLDNRQYQQWLALVNENIQYLGNVELMASDGETHSVLSNFHLYYARPGIDDVVYSGQRRDTLLEQPEGFQILRREVIMDYANIAVPTLGLLF